MINPYVIAAIIAMLACRREHEVPLPTAASTPLPAPRAPAKIPVAFVIAPGAVVVDFAGPWGVFEFAQPPGYQESAFQLYTVSDRADPVAVSGGMKIVPDYTFDTAPAPKLVVVPAQSEPSQAEFDWLRRIAPHVDLTMSVCDGAFVLAKAGLLAGKPATAHHGSYNALAADFPDIDVRRGARFVDADGVSTAGGLTSGTDLALHIVDRYFGRDVARQTATLLEYQGRGWLDPSSNVEFATKPVSTPERPLCPVCGMAVDKATAPHEEVHGQTYYFCSEADKARFDRAPERFIDPT